MFTLALDQGTTSSRAILFDREGNAAGTAQREIAQHYPRPGHVEHDPSEIWKSQLEVARRAMEAAQAAPSDIAAIGIANQRETTVLWDRQTGEPVARAIVWQDRRTADACDRLKSGGHADLIQERTGLVVDPYFSATKIQWLLDNVDGARYRAERGELAAGTIDSWLVYRLTGGEAHVTDASNASRTMLMDIRRGKWDEDLLALFDVPPSILPEIRSSSEVIARTSPGILGARIPIAGIAGDQQAALFGQVCTKPGMVKNTYGTGCFMLMNVGPEPAVSSNNLLTTVAWKLDDEMTYALEGSVFVAGAVVQWLRDGLGIIRTSEEIEALAMTVEDNDGVYLVPAFVGLGAPHWDPGARGTIAGITRGTTSGHIARAALESIAYQTLDVIRAMEKDAGMGISELRVDGGASSNDFLLQFQADLLGTSVVRPKVLETTALGAAFLAGLAVGFWQDLDEIGHLWGIDRTFERKMEPHRVDRMVDGWLDALDRARSIHPQRHP